MTEKPTTKQEMPKAYEPGKVEQKWYKFWLEKGYFTPEIDPKKKPFVIIMPPPNVTGELHIGHALTDTLEDIMLRWHRMLGEPSLWLPGVDHAGIAAQVVVEKLLAKEGLSRHKLGREKFVERMWQWAKKCRETITIQHQRLGASCDWTRERFTMEEGPSRAVRTVFVRLYNKKLIYRGERIINWCPRCATALSDLEVEHKDVKGHLWYVRYPLVEAQGKFITVATTRPETILGDTAVAVNPRDERYKGLIDKRVILPAVHRIIPIIADDAVDPSFGTGAVKITPAHDPVDFEVAKRHNLPLINIMNLDATMNENAGHYAGMDRFDCRKAILADLEKDGLLEKVEPYSHAIGHCDRCKAIVEPLASKQWFVNMPPLAKPAIEAVTSGKITIIPDYFNKVYLNWMENIRDWCISRQLWWGHQLPAWYCGGCDGDRIQLKLTNGLRDKYGLEKEIYTYTELSKLQPGHEEIVNNIEWASIDIDVEPLVSETDPERCPRCNSTNLIRDPDVLDTWFSSALWPHSTLGWPDKAPDFEYFYPTTVMETGYDILFFWVARMIMMGLEDTGDIPFQTVYLHGLIRDEKGEKMSKVRGNVINPIKTLEEYGTDALRFALSTGTAPGNDIKMNPARLEAGRNFANKLWNAARFVIRSIEPGEANFKIDRDSLSVEDRWLLSRLNRTISSITNLMKDFQFGEAQRQLYEFLWGEYCDWYIEFSKTRLRPDTDQTSPIPVLVYTLETSLRLLHPYMPFITEELWQNLKRYMPADQLKTESIMIAPYPEADETAIDPESETIMDTVIEIVRAIRNARAEYKVDSARWIEVQIYADRLTPSLIPHSQTIQNLAKAKPVTFLNKREEAHPREESLVLVLKKTEVTIPMGSMVDIAAERNRLQKEIEQIQTEVSSLESRLQNQDFLDKAPLIVVQKEKDKLAMRKDKLERLKQQIAKI